MTANKPGAKGLPKAQALPPDSGTPGGIADAPMATPMTAEATQKHRVAQPLPQPIQLDANSTASGKAMQTLHAAPTRHAVPTDAPSQASTAAHPRPSVQPSGGPTAAPSTLATTAAAPLHVAGQAPRAIQAAQAAGTVAAPLRPIPVQPAAAGLVRPRQAEQQEEPPTEEQLKELALKNGPPWMISMVLHMIAVLIMGLIWLPNMGSRKTVDLEAVYAEDLGEQIQAQPFEVAPADQPEVSEQIAALETLPLVEDPNMAPPEVPLRPEGIGAEALLNAPVVGSPLQGRELGIKQQLLRRYGGSEVTEQAVLEGLKWLARQQQKDGSWSLKGPYADGALNERAEAATAMALLAFQGAGNTHRRGQFKDNVARGIKALLAFQDAEGNFYPRTGGNAALYTQAQCTIALCELYGMTGDSLLRDPAELAVRYCIEAQDALGGWRYQKAVDSDTSVTGWMVMALQSARMAGIEVPPQVFKKVEMYLDKAAYDGGAQYKYQPDDGEPKLSMTAEGLLCRQYLGWRRNDPRLIQGCEILVRNLPSWDDRDVYYWYYATQVLHHMEGPYWEQWNAVMRQLLPEKQEKQGAERGSWHPTKPTMDAWGPQAGRLYVTCLSLYMLEVYYRHLPIYSPLNKLLREP